jgi:hypothetical protein
MSILRRLMTKSIRKVEIKIDPNTLSKVSSRQGMYNTRPAGELSKEAILKIVEESFKEYALKHGCPEAQLTVEWGRFEKIFRRRY